MRDVARLAGVSQSTVSRVLNDSYSRLPISAETRQRIFQAVEQLNFRPNRTARSLRTQDTCMIAVMIADISNPFYHSIVRAIHNITRAHDYDVLFSNTDHVPDNERHFCETVMHRPVDGVIMVPFHLTDEDLDEIIYRGQMPIVALGQHVQHRQVDVVFTDDEQATLESVSLLSGKGHRRIAYIGTSVETGVGERRYRGYRRALELAGLPLDPSLVQEGDFSIESGRKAMHPLMDIAQPPTAVCASNDLMAMGAMETIVDMGLRVPQDVAIMGFDDIPEATLIRPRLTTVAQKPDEIGRQLTEALLDRIEGRFSGERRIFEVPYEVIVRESA